MADDRHEFDCYATTPAEDMVIAQRAFEEGDLDHAARHVACALSVSPCPQYAAFLDELMAASPDPLKLAPLGGETFFGTVAIRAYILHSLGHHLEAIDLLLQVIGVRPDVPYTAWLKGWLEEEEVLEAIEPDAFAVAVQRCFEQLGATELGVQCERTVAPELIAMVARVRQRHPDHGPLALIHSRAARELGDLDDAFTVAEDYYRRVPGYLSAVTLAGAYRALGDRARAIELFHEALERSPDDVAVRLDIGDLWLELERPDEALSAYREVLALEEEHPWALPSALYAQLLLSGDVELRDRLEAIAVDSARHDREPNERALALLEAVTPYVGYLPDRQEAIINAARQALERGTSVVGLTLSSFEAPSAVASALSALKELGEAPEITVLNAPTPDPREPRAEGLYRLWRYEGLQARPCFPPPEASVAQAVAELALSPYHLDDWTQRGRALGRELGFVALEQLLAVMVHPPPRPVELSPWRWTFSVQVAAALTVSAVDEGWEDSVRRRALLSMINGPVDWTATAAIVALTTLACSEEALTGEITQLFDELLCAPETPIWHSCVEEPLVHCMLLLPGLSAHHRSRLRARRAQLEQQG